MLYTEVVNNDKCSLLSHIIFSLTPTAIAGIVPTMREVVLVGILGIVIIVVVMKMWRNSSGECFKHCFCQLPSHLVMYISAKKSCYSSKNVDSILGYTLGTCLDHDFDHAFLHPLFSYLEMDSCRISPNI